MKNRIVIVFDCMVERIVLLYGCVVKLEMSRWSGTDLCFMLFQQISEDEVLFYASTANDALMSY